MEWCQRRPAAAAANAAAAIVVTVIAATAIVAVTTMLKATQAQRHDVALPPVSLLLHVLHRQRRDLGEQHVAEAL
jgi:hypothetical protein